ncbi:MAG: hypothetical protein K2M48_03365 [Clostridiales bacterium]|nr:hypothetical protein [Clostridiales bacterium]
MKDPYSVLGLSRDSDSELLRAKYKELHDLYGEQRFKSGEEGNEGARKLQELEEAWVLISSDLDKNDKQTAFGGDYDRIDSLIRDGKYNEAQDMLDSITERKGEWHYMQAIVFYKREWLIEAKTQLEMALQDDPNNSKYRNSLDKLNMTLGGGPRPQQQQPYVNNGGNMGQNDAPYNGGQYNGGNNQPQQGDQMANCLSSCCCAYCLTDCLCSAMRCC